ncbi:hypothetical protein ADL19_14810 [Streptomyces purpurogeneiscleroticus]|nr:hypothetical protein ADL19_14810 [Streptomyces purpurogeneiscleroticus]
MSIELKLDVPSLVKLLQESPASFGVSIRQAAVAEVTRRAFKQYMPDEAKVAIDRVIEAVRTEFYTAMRTEGRVEQLLKERIESFKRGVSLSYLSPTIEKSARDMVDEIMGLLVRKIVLEKMESPEGVQQIVDAKVQAITDRLIARLDRDDFTSKVDAQIAAHIDAIIQQRVATAMAAVQQAGGASA